MSAENPAEYFLPPEGLTYNPNDADYLDPQALQAELDRSFDLCHSCRLCFKYCDSFPSLFRAVDNKDGVARGLDTSVTRQVVDECFGCKLCYVNCPYTEAEGHAYKLDFPALMLRARSKRAEEEGIPFRERLLSDPDKRGKEGSFLPVITNTANKSPIFRLLLEKTAGIHRDKSLPEFHSPTFEAWFVSKSDGKTEISGEHPVVLFHTCFVNYNEPQIGMDAVDVMEHNNCQIACPSQNCCGMPALDSGDIDFARDQAAANVRTLLPYVEKGYRIAAINPTCSLMIKKEYPVLLSADPDLADAAVRVSEATRDLSEFFFELRKEGHYKEDYKSSPESDIAYHVACHLKMQAIGFRSRDLMRKIPDVKVRLVNECSGHDGTWAMKTENFEASMRIGKKAFDGMQEIGSEVWTSDCPLAALQIEQATGKRPVHPVQILARAYREDGFSHPVEEDATE
jgi:glycerol-3-phosphate dehydrogenase subunit C